MLKIRRPLGRLIFNMGIAIPGKTVFLIETAPSKPRKTMCIFMECIAHYLTRCQVLPTILSSLIYQFRLGCVNWQETETALRNKTHQMEVVSLAWLNAEILLLGLLGSGFSEILIGIQTFSLKKCKWDGTKPLSEPMQVVYWTLSYKLHWVYGGHFLGINVLRELIRYCSSYIEVSSVNCNITWASWYPKHWELHCLFNIFFKVITNKTSMFCITGPLWGECTSDQWIPNQRANNVVMFHVTWCHMIWINLGSGNVLLPDGTNPLSEPMLAYNQRYSVTFAWEQFHKKCS